MEIPEKGEYYYHFKHDIDGDVNNMAYIIVGIGTHAETEEKLVLYKRLYEREGGHEISARPLEMFMDEVEKPNYTGKRFVKIIDADVIEKLKEFE